MYYFIYKTTNKINQKYYYGAHSTENINDGYLGSGVSLKKAILKYGKENFSREIVEFCHDNEEMYLKEEKIVSEHYRNDQCYNMNVGGRGGWNYVNSNGLSKGPNNPMIKYPELREYISKIQKELKTGNEKYVSIARENLKKAVEVNTGKKRPEHSEFMREWSKNNWENNKEYIRDCLSSNFKITSPEGDEYLTNRLEEWCKEKNLPYSTLWVSSSKNGKIVTKGKAKGWKCELI